jgi:hypothetical protein
MLLGSRIKIRGNFCGKSRKYLGKLPGRERHSGHGCDVIDEAAISLVVAAVVQNRDAIEGTMPAL